MTQHVGNGFVSPYLAGLIIKQPQSATPVCNPAYGTAGGGEVVPHCGRLEIHSIRNTDGGTRLCGDVGWLEFVI